MNISSMTGFSRADGSFENDMSKYSFSFEIKTVNAKGLDIKIKLPSGFEELEGEIKNQISQNFVRGTFNVFLNLQNESQNADVKINNELLDVLKNEALKIYFENEDMFSKPSPIELFKIPGVVKVADYVLDDESKILLHKAVFETLDTALQKLKDDRLKEGEKIANALLHILDEIDLKRQSVEKITQNSQENIRLKISEQIKNLVNDPNVSAERLEQEVLFYVMRADVQEEIDRLRAHVQTARDIFKNGGPVGRRLDFLCQELNRETNTLCSKSMDLEQTKIGMELKALIEQFREQVQNME